MHYPLISLLTMFTITVSVNSPSYGASTMQLPTPDRVFNIELFNSYNPKNMNTIIIQLDDHLSMIARQGQEDYLVILTDDRYSPRNHGYSVYSYYYLSGHLKTTFSQFKYVRLSSYVQYDELGNETSRLDYISTTPEAWLSEFGEVLKTRYMMDIWQDYYGVGDGMTSKLIDIYYAQAPSKEPGEFVTVPIMPYDKLSPYFKITLNKHTFEEVSWVKVTPRHDPDSRQIIQELTPVRGDNQ